MFPISLPLNGVKLVFVCNAIDKMVISCDKSLETKNLLVSAYREFTLRKNVHELVFRAQPEPQQAEREIKKFLHK